MADLAPCPAQASEAIVLVEPGASPHTFDANSERYAWENNSVGSQGTLEITQASSGQRQRHISRARKTSESVQGNLTGRPHLAGLDLWIPRIIGGTKDGSNIIEPTVAIPKFGLMTHSVGAVEVYNDLQVASAVFSAQAQQTLQMSLELFGQNYLTGQSLPGTLPTIETGEIYNEILFGVAELEFQGDKTCFDNFQLSINNQISQRFYNSLTAKCTPADERIVQVSFGTPWNADVANRWYRSGDDGDGAVIRFIVSADYRIEFRLGGLKWIDNPPVIPGQGDIEYTISAEAFQTDTAHDIEVLIDTTGP